MAELIEISFGLRTGGPGEQCRPMGPRSPMGRGSIFLGGGASHCKV